MRIRLKQTVRFIDRKSLAIVQPELIVNASNETQNVPDWLQDTLEFELLQESGHLEVIASPAPRNRIPSAASVGGAGIGDTGIPQGSDADPTKEGNEENLKLVETIDHAAENVRLRQQLADLQKKAELDLKPAPSPTEIEALRKSSGQDGDAGDWTQAGRRADGSPCEKGSPEDTTATPAEKGAYTRRLNAASQAGSRG
jgi:hypothetical protein